jgi:transposase
MARFEVITGLERRRRWSADRKWAIVAESVAPGAVVSEAARRADLSPGQIYRRRQELRAAAGFDPQCVEEDQKKISG